MTMQPTNVNYEVSAQMGQFYVAVYREQPRIEIREYSREGLDLISEHLTLLGSVVPATKCE